MARIVLVHGAFGGAWVWGPVIGGLEHAGHRVETFDLPGSGEDMTPVELVTLDAYAQRICTQLAQSDEPAVLVGHSLGGVAMTEAAGRCPGRISLLVYLAAMQPRDGQSLIDLTQLPEGQTNQVEPHMVLDGEPPVATLSDAGARVAFYGGCSEEQIAWALPRGRPQAAAPFFAPVSFADPAAREIPRAAIVCTRDLAVPTALQRRLSSENSCREVLEIDTDHSPWLSATDELVAALDRLALGAPEPVAAGAGGCSPSPGACATGGAR
jgi:pimeloyl-ACP methyl ester carboxylesterase